MKKLVESLGRTGFAAVTSLIWALPMAAWAGSADLSPIDRTAYPGIALAIGTVMLLVWLVMLTQLSRIPVSRKQRRFEIAQMSPQEKRWTLAAIAFFTGIVAWFNTAATVDLTPLYTAITNGKPQAILFATVLLATLAILVAGLKATWRKETSAYRDRLSSLSNMR